MNINWKTQQKQFVSDQFAKLVQNFLIDSEQELVKIDWELVDWESLAPTKLGFTKYFPDGSLKISLRYHTDFEELLDTIAHEFAHVYLILRDTVSHNCQELKHILFTNYFYKCLKK